MFASLEKNLAKAIVEAEDKSDPTSKKSATLGV